MSSEKYSSKISEATLKNKVAKDFFSSFDTTNDLNSNIDFIVASKEDSLFQDYYCFAEAKKANEDNIKSLIQLILTIGRAKNLPTPAFLAAFNCQEIIFIPFSKIRFIFAQNDFNWKVTPSDHHSKEFAQMQGLIGEILEQEKLSYSFSCDEKELRHFITQHFRGSSEPLEINEDNLVEVYEKWLYNVSSTIIFSEENKKQLRTEYGAIEADFFLADLLPVDKTLLDKLYILLEQDKYKIIRDKKGNMRNLVEVPFTDKQAAHKAFWRRYKRPPDKEIWDILIKRRDLLVPSDLRERKGAFFTPSRWVTKSHEYIAKALGEDWQEHYAVWDLAAGTGNLLAGLENGHIFASTLDDADVGAMQTRRELAGDEKKLKEKHIFKFDFLNDPLPCVLHSDPKQYENQCFNCKNFDPEKTTLPKPLIDILKDEKKRQKLIILINPPYAEAGNKRKMHSANEEHKGKVATHNAIYDKYKKDLGKASNELFAQFFMRIYEEIPGCILAQFSKLKIAQGANFEKFRGHFKAKFLRGFVVPAASFDNVKGAFPIGFMVWDLAKRAKVMQECIPLDIFSRHNQPLGVKNCYTNEGRENIGKWIASFRVKNPSPNLGMMDSGRLTFQHQNIVRLENIITDKAHALTLTLTLTNLIPCCIFFAVRHAIPASWLNDRDQFLWPSQQWKEDKEFQHDCLAFTLFHKQNRIVSQKDGTNHFIPFTSDEVGAKESFKSEFMSEFLAGKIKLERPPLVEKKENKIWSNEELGLKPEFREQYFDFSPAEALKFSPEAKAVFEKGKELFSYYHGLDESRFYPSPYNANASLYEIKEFFQGRGKTGKMNPPKKCKDEHYKELLSELNNCLIDLAKKIKDKIYEYGFLRE